jgi:hypothetical protein
MQYNAAQLDQIDDVTARKLLLALLDSLDKLERQDFFGTEGWRYYLELEDITIQRPPKHK